MSIKVALRHSTHYKFDRRVKLTPHVVRLRPAPHTRTTIDSYSLKIEPEGHFINWQQDPYGNYLARLVFPEKVKSLHIDVEVIADLVAINPFDFFLDEENDEFPFQYDEQLQHDLAPYLVKKETAIVEDWIKKVDKTKRRTVDFLVDLIQQLESDISYTVRMEPGVQTCEQTLTKLSGSCRDSAWLLVQILRHLGLASRFVSGYLVQLSSDEKPVDGPAGPEQDFTDLHAWTEVYLPGAGWVGMDPTSGLFASEGHIPLACSPEPDSAAAVTGAVEPCETELEFENSVTRVHEDPRVTKPYSDKEWQAIIKLGDKVEEKLVANDIRLTMGGEPTFVSIDDMESPQWNIEALGDDKRRLADSLVESLKEEFAGNGLLHTSQGKWYPGEPLPRWALSLYWRRDGEPLWQDSNLLADTRTAPKHTHATAKQFMETLADKLAVQKKYIRPAYEDVFQSLINERRLPDNVDPFDNKLDDPLERERIRRHFEQGLDAEVGYALPLGYSPESLERSRWRSCDWRFRQNRMYLLPGDSPMGYRLPLESLPWIVPEERPIHPESDPFALRNPLLKPLNLELQRVRDQLNLKYDEAYSAETHLITALCAETRNGQLHVFLPPVMELEGFVDLLSCIESAAKELGTPIIVEGYPPPKDDRLEVLQVTPDPGVIEVNIHPSRDWKTLVSNTEKLYAMAREKRLGAEKFMLDGRHTGTGGGNHVTLGGTTVADSPFLRKPELLGSLLRYWQNHPSLSYLFSGMFIGPTSQAPRVDEARDDNLYELEIALSHLPEGEIEQPWLVDRILRNFLVDLTGNTHRSEFCIDKLYSPDATSGRRGLVEMRAFEMPPHARMSIIQMLLIRALVARFWEKPCHLPLVPYGTALHDRYMLPHFVWSDFSEVIEEMQSSGFNFKRDWFSAFYEFRFPKIGEIFVNDIHLELRSAIEPWHVLGEESGAQSTARYVDSSVERIQVRVSGLYGNRYAISCNGRRLPLRESGVSGEHVAAVRFKAWNPPSSLHPVIEPQAPLVFDIIDTHNQRSIGGCQYHVSHPGGRSEDTFPVNANAAESRRMSRFVEHGHTQKTFKLETEQPHPVHPLTLDLRYRPMDLK